MSKRTFCINGASAIALVASTALAQAPSPSRTHETVSVRASKAYDHGGLWRTFFGDEWRDVWPAQITVPVLDLDLYAGGLEPYKAGGNQSKTLRFHGADGRTYIFRSTEKYVKKTLPKDVKTSPLMGLAQDQAASLHPTGPLVVAELQDALGLLQAPPTLVLLPDDPRLGEFREDFANMLGTIEERPDDDGKNGVTFAGAKKISSSSKLLEKLEESTEDTLDRREYLTARLLDFLIGDTDRGSDQWHFAKFEHGKHDIYRPIPRDRDYAFMKVTGLVAGLADLVQPRLVCFDENYPGISSLLYMTADFDRSHLIDLSWRDWKAVAASMQQRLTNDVIDRAVMQLPAAHREKSGAEIVAGLRARRDALSEIAREYYLVVNQEADIFASDEAERAEIDRDSDGSVRVRLWRAEGMDAPVASLASTARPSSLHGPDGPPIFDRRFARDETREVRVYLERGDDRAVVRGAADRSIKVRVIGGEGDDVLADSSDAPRGASTYFYDAAGENTFVRGSRTRVVTNPFATDPPHNWDKDEDEPETNPRELSEERRGRFRDLMMDEDADFEEKLRPGDRYWGSSSGLDPMTGYRESGGVLLGAGPTTTHFGFRRRPYDWHAELHGMVGTRNGELGARLRTDRHFENSPWSIALLAHVSNLESNRFYGYGNDTELLDPEFTLVERFEVLVQPSFQYSIRKNSTLDFGPIVRYVDPNIPGDSPAADAMPLGSEPFGQAGGRADLVLDWTDVTAEKQSGVGFNTGLSAYPSAWDADQAFGEAHALARLFVPIGWPTLALRAGGQHSWGEFPLHESAFIGGRWSVRGFRWNRFAGDTSAYGSVELRVPVAQMTLLSRGQLGVIGFSDTGRVWMDGDSAGKWHTGFGGGLWFGTLTRQVSFTYAYGDEHRVYFYGGMPF